uniref:YokE-like PH domain-containing protein n=1 Tax=Staphylococcus staphylolyticus TaxID=1287 RepID=D3X7L9_STAST|nr:PH domain-containing protein [Staphylococcus simulans]ADD24891.1 conserved hypothetical protein [Staphylococcus simulans bv. staphylolyticus]
MILDKVNPDDLFPTERVEYTVKGKMAYPINGEVKMFEAAYIATNERLILNVDMSGEFYYRNIPYDDVKDMTLSKEVLDITFEVGTFIFKDFDYVDAKKMIDYISNL